MRPMILALLTAALTLTTLRSAEACSVSSPQPYELDDGSDDAVAPEMHDVRVEFDRARHPGECGAHGDCGNLAWFRILPVATDDGPGELGYELAVIDGTFGDGPTSEPVRAGDDGWIRDPFSDDGASFRFTLSVTALDRAGNRSQPFTIEVVEGTNDNGCGFGPCAMAPAPPQGTAAAPTALVACALLLLRRRPEGQKSDPRGAGSTSWLVGQRSCRRGIVVRRYPPSTLGTGGPRR